MSENSSDSESSCGWTIINHEGSDVETLHPQNGEPYYDLASVLQSHTGEVTSVLASEQAADCVQEQQYEELGEQSGTSEGAVPCVESQLLAKEETQPAPEVSLFHDVSAELENVPPNELRCQKKGSPLADGQCEAASDDSDIVTLEVEAVGELEKGTSMEEQVEDTGNVNMSSSFSSQYTFSHADSVFPAQHSVDESSNDEASDDSGPSLRRRRSKRPTSSLCEPENSPPIHQLAAPKPKALFQLGSLNKCIILFLVIATSMGFGHFYGTIQILERQKMAEKIHEDELNDMKDDLFQCQKDQETTMEQNEVAEKLTEDLEDGQDMVSSLKGLMDKMTKDNQLLRQKHTDLKFEVDDLSTSLKTTEVEKKNLVVENQHLQESLEKEERALSSLQEELRKLREQIRNLEEKGRGESMLSENQKLKAHLIEERQKVRSFRTQKEKLLTEAQILRTELDNERQITEALKAQLEEMMSNREAPESENSKNENQDIKHLRERLYDLENKLNFEQQRSDLWERLYVEAKEQNEKLETESIHNSKEKEQSKNSKARDKSKKKVKDTFFSSVKDTFDAMKNSTKEFVRHHKEKIKQAKEAVKENLKKFSDSVKTTFRHFKDSTKNMFDKNRYKKYTERRREEAKEANTVRREYNPETQEYGPKKETVTQKYYKRPQDAPSTEDQNTRKSDTVGKESSDQYSTKKGCSGVFECAHQESTSLFNKVLDPVRVEEFNHLMQIYLQGQVANFRHWKELQQFINRFFHNGVFIHDRMLFTDFVNDVEDYLEDMEEYQTKNGGVFEDLDEFVYRHYFGNNYPNSFGPRKPEKNSLQKDPESQRYQRQEQKNSQHRYRKDGKWQKHGRTNGRHMANVEIELGQLPFDPKY